MKLNERGLALKRVWNAKWNKAIRLDSVANGGKGEEGWGVVYDHNMVKTVEDHIGIMLAANGDGAIEEEMFNITNNFTSHVSGKPYVKNENGEPVTCREYITAMSKYFDLSAEDRARIDHFFTSKVKVNKTNMLSVCIYCDTTEGLYSEIEIDYDNLCEMLFPEPIVRAWYEEHVKENAESNSFEEWLMKESTADDTEGLYQFAKEHGFTGKRTTYTFYWDGFTATDFERLRDGGLDYYASHDFLGHVRTGDLCFDLVFRDFAEETEGRSWAPALCFDLYVGGIDSGYGYSDRYDNHEYPYDENDGFGFVLPDELKDITYHAFIKKAEAKCAEFINGLGEDIKAKGIEPLHLW